MALEVEVDGSAHLQARGVETGCAEVAALCGIGGHEIGGDIHFLRRSCVSGRAGRRVRVRAETVVAGPNHARSARGDVRKHAAAGGWQPRRLQVDTGGSSSRGAERRMTGLGGAATLRGHMPPEWAAELEGV